MNRLLKIPHISTKTLLLVAVVVAVTLALSMGISVLLNRYHNLHVPSIGTIYALGVEAYGGDITYKNDTQCIDWGTVYIGTSTNRSVYIRSRSNIPTTLSLAIANLTFEDAQGNPAEPPNGDYVQLTWNYDNSTVTPNQEIHVTLTLSISYDSNFINYLITNQISNFSFDIRIYPPQP